MKLDDLPKHHAVLLVRGERDIFAGRLWGELRELSPAHTFFDQTVLNIETARAIISWAQTPYNEEKIALISFHTIGLEAQNTLLKILEEPRPSVRFILLTSNKANLIDTVLSRVQYVSTTDDEEVLSYAELFLKTKHSLRMKLPFIVELLSRVDEEDRKDKEGVRTFILSLATLLSSQEGTSRYVLETIDVASNASLPSASGKALIEYLALLLPQTSV